MRKNVGTAPELVKGLIGGQSTGRSGPLGNIGNRTHIPPMRTNVREPYPYVATGARRRVLGRDWDPYTMGPEPEWEPVELMEVVRSPEEDYGDRQAERRLSMALRTLTASEWEVLQLCFYEGLSVEVAARRLHRETMWVKATRRWALRKLLTAMTDRSIAA